MSIFKKKSKQSVEAVVPSAGNDGISALINSITDAVFSVNQDGIIQEYNSAALNLLDTNIDVRGRYIGDLLILEDGHKKNVDIFKELSKSNTIRKRDDLISPLVDGDQLRLEATFAPVQGSSHIGDPDTYVLVLKDITKAKSLSEEQDEFISVVSHELRTPVAIAEGSLSNAELLAERGMLDKVPEAISEARKQVVFLAKIVNDLSTLSRAERGVSDDSEEIDTVALGHQLHKDHSPQAAKKNLHLNLDIVGHPGSVYVSRLYLQELLQNFIINAIKYTQEGSVTLRISQEDDKVVFEVADTGIGIAKADRDKIFSRFYRAEDYRTRETNGTGLGLYVASKLANKLNCKIELDSRLNHGSSFKIALDAIDPSDKTVD